MALEIAQHYTELIKLAQAANLEGELEKAASFYEKAIRQEPFVEKPYAQLMKIYRQLKQYKEELRVIDKALAVFEEHYDKRPEKILGKNSKAAQLSKALLKSIGDKDQEDYPEPIPKWRKRKAVVEKRLKKK
jgi:tetratricopeptide (TPR) repeat protein